MKWSLKPSVVPWRHSPPPYTSTGTGCQWDYEVEQGVGVVRLRLKEGQARRLQPRDVPPLDRPVRFTVLRGKREAVRSESWRICTAS